jgi:hypothetical protein
LEEVEVINRDRLNDEYEMHQLRVGHLTKDQLDTLIADAHLVRHRWYNGLLAGIGEKLIAAGSSLKERNTGKRKNLSVSSMEVDT